MTQHIATELALGCALVIVCSGSPFPPGTLGRHGRQLAQVGLPENPTKTCSTSVLRQVIGAEEGCLNVLFTGETSERCCKHMESVVGSDIDAPTKNCFCVPEVLTEVDGYILAKGGVVTLPELTEACNSEFETKMGTYESIDGFCPNVAPVAPVASLVELPENPAEQCSLDVLVAAVGADEDCLTFLFGDEPVEKCCKLMDDISGTASTKDTKNCFCVPDVYEEVNSLIAQRGASLPFSELIESCNAEHDTKIGTVEGTDGLCAPPAPSTEGLPENPAETCSTQVLAQAVGGGGEECISFIFSGQAIEKCCKQLDEITGATSDLATKNCFCVPDVLAEVENNVAQQGGPVPFAELVEECNSKFETKVGTHQAPDNLCPNNTGLQGRQQRVKRERIPSRSFSEWVNDLKDEPAFLVTFIMSIPAGLGSLAFFWTLASALI